MSYTVIHLVDHSKIIDFYCGTLEHNDWKPLCYRERQDRAYAY